MRRRIRPFQSPRVLSIHLRVMLRAKFERGPAKGRDSLSRVRVASICSATNPITSYPRRIAGPTRLPLTSMSAGFSPLARDIGRSRPSTPTPTNARSRFTPRGWGAFRRWCWRACGDVARCMGSQRRGNARYGVSHGTPVPLEFRVAIGAGCVELVRVEVVKRGTGTQLLG